MLSTITSLIHYLETNLSWPNITWGELASFILLLFFVMLSALEYRRPKRKWPLQQLRQSYRTNIGLFMLNSMVLSLISASSLFVLADRYSAGGLLNNFSNPVLKAGLSLLLLDLIYYLWHKASHSFDWLWLFHRVHHNDPYLNVSTAFRIHLIELLIATGLKALYIVGLGVGLNLVIAYEALMLLFVMFHHTNISFPGEKWVGKLFIVPYLHRVHHSTQRLEHDSNYGAVLSIWDRLFKTLLEQDPIEIGIKGESPQTLFKLVKFGFINSAQPLARPINASPLMHSMIAEAAYFKAEKRGFYPGYELCDWLEAEKELRHIAESETVTRKRSSRNDIRECFKLGCIIGRPLIN